MRQLLEMEDDTNNWLKEMKAWWAYALRVETGHASEQDTVMKKHAQRYSNIINLYIPMGILETDVNTAVS